MSEIKIGRLSRDMEPAQIEIRAATTEDATVRLSFPLSSETPVERWFGREVLSHGDGAVMLDRIKGGAAPLLFNHNWNDPIGMIDGGRVKDGRLYVDAHLFDTARAKEVEAMIRGGLRNVSVGYEIEELTEDKKTETFTATRWLPLEGSVCTVPADAGVGIGRQADDSAKPVRVVRAADAEAPPTEPKPAATRAAEVTTPAAPAALHRSIAVSDQVNAAAGVPNAEQKPVTLDPLQIERDRRQAIANLCRANKIDSRIEEQWCRDGVRLEEVSGKILEIIEERGKSRPTAMSDLGLSRSETQRFSLFRAIRAMKTPTAENINAAAYELECSRELAKRLQREGSGNIFIPGEVLQRPLGEAATRAMAVVPGGKGGYMVDTTNMGFLDILRARSVSMRMGARRLPGLVGNVTLTRQTGKGSVSWQAGEHATITAADQALGQLSMTPKTAIAITDVSEQALRQTSGAMEAFVMADLAADIAIDGVDYTAINGVGGAQPMGIKNTPGVASGQDAAAATYAKILAFVSTAGAANAIRGNPGFVTNTAGASVLMQKQRFSGTDTPLWTGNMLDGQCVGFNAMSSEQMASGNLIFGSWDEMVIGEWGVLELATDNGGTRFNTATVGIRAMWMVDVLVRYPQAFVVSTNLSA
jgi:HK97 family phage major capsid protein/HK97 family phage prohead protease